MYTPEELVSKIEALPNFTESFEQMPPELYNCINPLWKNIVQNLAIIKEKLNSFSEVNEYFMAIFDSLEAIEQGLPIDDIMEEFFSLLTNTFNYIKTLNLIGNSFFLLIFAYYF